MRRALVGSLLVVTVLLAACAPPGAPKRTAADQDRDGRAVAAAIASADQDGSSFHLDETLTFTGGDIPSNQELQIKASADGVAKDGRVRMTYKIETGKNKSVSYDIVVADQLLFIKPHSSAQWKRSSSDAATALYPALRLPLLRESVLLAQSVGAGSVTTVNNGFAHRYKVIPARDQLEQLQAIPVSGSQETLFLKTASAEIDAFLTMTGDKLTRIEVHLSGQDPTNGETQKVDSIADYRPARVDAIETPASSVLVGPDQILNQS